MDPVVSHYSPATAGTRMTLASHLYLDLPTEGWQNGWHKIVRCTSPVVWTFICALCEQQAKTDQQIGRLPTASRGFLLHDGLDLYVALERIVMAWENESSDVTDYLDLVSVTMYVYCYTNSLFATI